MNIYIFIPDLSLILVKISYFLEYHNLAIIHHFERLINTSFICFTEQLEYLFSFSTLMNNFIDGLLHLSWYLFELGITNKGFVNSWSNSFYFLHFSVWKFQAEAFFMKHCSWNYYINVARVKQFRLTNKNWGSCWNN